MSQLAPTSSVRSIYQLPGPVDPVISGWQQAHCWMPKTGQGGGAGAWAGRGDPARQRPRFSDRPGPEPLDRGSSQLAQAQSTRLVEVEPAARIRRAVRLVAQFAPDDANGVDDPDGVESIGVLHVSEESIGVLHVSEESIADIEQQLHLTRVAALLGEFAHDGGPWRFTEVEATARERPQVARTDRRRDVAENTRSCASRQSA